MPTKLFAPLICALLLCACSPELAETVARQYPLQEYASPFDALTAAFSDGFFNCITRWQTIALSRHVASGVNKQNCTFWEGLNYLRPVHQ